MKTLTELIQNYQNGIPNSDSEILKRMEPLVKGYASRIHCMEREDSTQELYLTLLKTLPYLSSSSLKHFSMCLNRNLYISSFKSKLYSLITGSSPLLSNMWITASFMLISFTYSI